jgi:hypothetical protein
MTPDESTDLDLSSIERVLPVTTTTTFIRPSRRPRPAFRLNSSSQFGRGGGGIKKAVQVTTYYHPRRSELKVAIRYNAPMAALFRFMAVRFSNSQENLVFWYGGYRLTDLDTPRSVCFEQTPDTLFLIAEHILIM